MNEEILESDKTQIRLYYDFILEKYQNEKEKSHELDDFAKYIASVSGIIIGAFSSSLLVSANVLQPFKQVLLLLVFSFFIVVIYISGILIFKSQLTFISKDVCLFEQDSVDMRQRELFVQSMLNDLIEDTKKQRKYNEDKIKHLYHIFSLFVMGILTLIIYTAYTLNSFQKIVDILPNQMIIYFGIDASLDIFIFLFYCLLMLVTVGILRSSSKHLSDKLSEVPKGK